MLSLPVDGIIGVNEDALYIIKDIPRAAKHRLFQPRGSFYASAFFIVCCLFIVCLYMIYKIFTNSLQRICKNRLTKKMRSVILVISILAL